jgi:prepilin-type N-terminal cleavage/methylation domain-containing protein/prepilin-type processing-associated H-X9-DG protein
MSRLCTSDRVIVRQNTLAGRRRAFTLVELLVVLGIIAVLIGILMPTFSRARLAAQRTQCMSNLRMLTTAWVAYAADHRGALVNGQAGSAGAWAAAGNAEQNVRDGVLFPYCPHPGVDRCPVDHSDHARSYSINNYLNGERGWPMKRIDLLAAIRNAAETMVFLEENDPRGWDAGSFIVLRDGDQWVDFPVTWHEKGMCVSFADGHVEYYHFSDPRTSQITWFYTDSPNNADLKWFQARVGY